MPLLQRRLRPKGMAVNTIDKADWNGTWQFPEDTHSWIGPGKPTLKERFGVGRNKWIPVPILAALRFGPAHTVASLAGILNNRAVLCGLLLTFNIPAIYSPPMKEEDNKTVFITFFLSTILACTLGVWSVLTAVYSAFLLEQAGGSTFSTCYYLYNVGYWTSQLNEAAFTAQFTATTISVLVAAYAYTASTWYYWVAVALCCFTFCFVLFVVGQNMRALYFGEWTDLCNQVFDEEERLRSKGKEGSQPALMDKAAPRPTSAGIRSNKVAASPAEEAVGGTGCSTDGGPAVSSVQSVQAEAAVAMSKEGPRNNAILH